MVIHDADNTVRPNEISNFINALIDNPSSFINGTRFVYPMTLNAMKSSNFYGNIFFSYLFSLILNQSITDTLCGTKVFFRKYRVKWSNPVFKVKVLFDKCNI